MVRIIMKKTRRDLFTLYHLKISFFIANEYKNDLKGFQLKHYLEKFLNWTIIFINTRHA